MSIHPEEQIPGEDYWNGWLQDWYGWLTCIFGHLLLDKNYNIKEILGQIQVANRAHFTILQLIGLNNTSWRVQVMLHRMLVSGSVLYDTETWLSPRRSPIWLLEPLKWKSSEKYAGLCRPIRCGELDTMSRFTDCIMPDLHIPKTELKDAVCSVAKDLIQIQN